MESSDVHALVPEQRVEQRGLCCCAGRGAAEIIITEALAVALFFAFALEKVVSREIMSALLGAGSVIKAVQQQSNAKAIVCALEHDPNGILNVF